MWPSSSHRPRTSRKMARATNRSTFTSYSRYTYWYCLFTLETRTISKTMRWYHLRRPKFTGGLPKEIIKYQLTSTRPAKRRLQMTEMKVNLPKAKYCFLVAFCCFCAHRNTVRFVRLPAILIRRPTATLRSVGLFLALNLRWLRLSYYGPLTSMPTAVLLIFSHRSCAHLVSVALDFGFNVLDPPMVYFQLPRLSSISFCSRILFDFTWFPVHNGCTSIRPELLEMKSFVFLWFASICDPSK